MLLTTHAVEQQLEPLRVLEAEYVAAVVIEGTARLLIGSARRKSDRRALASSITTQLNRMIGRRPWQSDSFRILMLSSTPFVGLVSEASIAEVNEAILTAADQPGVTSCRGIEAELEYLQSLDGGVEPELDEPELDEPELDEPDESESDGHDDPPPTVRVTAVSTNRVTITRPARSSKSYNQQRVDYLNHASREELAWTEEIEVGLSDRIMAARPWVRVGDLAPNLFDGRRTPHQVAVFEGLLQRFPDPSRSKRRRRR